MVEFLLPLLTLSVGHCSLQYGRLKTWKQTIGDTYKVYHKGYLCIKVMGKGLDNEQDAPPPLSFMSNQRSLHGHLDDETGYGAT